NANTYTNANAGIIDSVHLLDTQTSTILASREGLYFHPSVGSKVQGGHLMPLNVLPPNHSGTNNNAKASLELLQAEMEVLKSDLSKLKAENTAYSERLRKLNYDHKVLREERNNFEATSNALHDQVNLLQSRLNNCLLDYQEKLMDMQTLQKQHKDLQQQCSKSQTTVQQLSSLVEQLTSQNQTLQKNMSHFSDEKKQMEESSLTFSVLLALFKNNNTFFVCV
ncbi:hypothetical protein RFI_14306, partial [Reticulomyxa filosa]